MGSNKCRPLPACSTIGTKAKSRMLWSSLTPKAQTCSDSRTVLVSLSKSLCKSDIRKSSNNGYGTNIYMYVFAMLLPCFIVCVCKCCKKVTYVYVCYVCMIGPLLSHIAHRPVPSPPSFSFLQLPSWICPRRFASVKDCQTWILASREVRPQSHQTHKLKVERSKPCRQKP